MEARKETLTKIRQLKQSSDTVKKIHKHGFTKGPYVETQGEDPGLQNKLQYRLQLYHQSAEISRVLQ